VRCTLSLNPSHTLSSIKSRARRRRVRLIRSTVGSNLRHFHWAMKNHPGLIIADVLEELWCVGGL
jgi:hypothetical protein